MAIGSEETADGAEADLAALGNSEDETRDSDGWSEAHKAEFHRWKGRKQMTQNVSFYSLNSQGLEGAWRMIHLLADGNIESADILMIQEVAATASQWKSMSRYMAMKGFKGFYTHGFEGGSKKNSHRHRGVATFVRDHLPVKMRFEHSWEGGQFHAIEIMEVLMINSYCSPQDSVIPEHIRLLGDHYSSSCWRGDWIAGGDWNECYDGSWVHTLTLLLDGHQCDTGLTSSTRWEGSRVIDYFVGSLPMSPLTTRLERISDHLIVRTEVEFECKKSVDVLHFKKDPIFKKPSWIPVHFWTQLLDEACQEGVETGWAEACHLADREFANDSVDVSEQYMVDFTWMVTCSQLSWMFRVASFAALLYIPDDFQDLEEIRRIKELANFRKIKGGHVSLMKRSLPKNRNRENESIRKKWKDLGRINAIRRQIQKRRFNEEGRKLALRFFNEEIEDISLRKIQDFEQQRRQEVEQLQRLHRSHNLSSWKKNMQNISFRSEWLNRKGFVKSPTVDDGSNQPANKVENAQKLWKYWDDFWKQQHWEPAEINNKKDELIGILKPKIQHACRSRARPNVWLFRKRIKSVKGCQGADGWAKEELLAISRCAVASKLVWDSMSIWEECGVSPSPVAHCKMVMLAKKDERQLKPDAYRPIAVQSAWWRAWSSTWLKSKWIQPWVMSSFPKFISGGIPGSIGPEVMAAVLDYQLLEAKHGVTLDLKHAFDTVHLDLLEGVLKEILPDSNLRWINLAFQHWRKMSRWVIFESHVCEQPLITSIGLPQGDPLSPLMMVLLMMALQEKVKMKMHGVELQHYIYMDDRTLLARTSADLNRAKAAWQEVADEYHLLENPDKAQFVNLQKKHDCFEVLGALLGVPLPADVKKSRAEKRLQKSCELYKKIRFIPESFVNRMKDTAVFGRGMTSYGWISHRPTATWRRKQQTEVWRGLGRTQYSAVSMRKIVSGATLHLDIVVLMKQLRLLQQRNHMLMEMYSIDPCLMRISSLEEMVTQQLIDLGWQRDDRFARWHHSVSPDGFILEDIADPIKWKEISHWVRESYRWIAFEDHKDSVRHELAGQDLGHYDPDRRNAAVKWARSDSTAYMLILGAIQSPLQRSMHERQFHSVCPRCNFENPHWDHLWKCFTNVVPADVLLRRYCWPKQVADLSLCTAFLNGMKEIN